MSLNIYFTEIRPTTVFDLNLTHNYGGMASAAGIYASLWRAPENGFTKARQLIEPLKAAILALETNPAKFIALEPENKWGTYPHFVRKVKELLAAAEQNPNADISISV